MTNTPAAQKTVRQWAKTPPLNGAGRDFYSSSGSRICMPIYVDVPHTLRKAWLNVLRDMCSTMMTSTPSTISGLQVDTASNSTSDVESYLGMSLDTLRTAVLFQRGGLPIDLVLKLQHLTEVEAVTDKELVAAFRNRQSDVKVFIQENPFKSEDDYFTVTDEDNAF